MEWGEIIARSIKTAEWRLIGSISKEEDITPMKFNKELDKLESRYHNLTIKLHSGGGSIYDGLQMYERLKNSNLNTTIDVEGIAASMASALFMAGKNRRIARFGRLMIHQGSGGVRGTASQIIEYGKELFSNNGKLAEIYAEAIKWKHPSRDKQWVIDNWMQEGKDTWFNAEEALAAGLVHEVISGVVKAAPTASMSFDEMVAHYDQSFNNNSNRMKREEILAKHGLSLDATDDDLLNKIEELQNGIEESNNMEVHSQIKACVLNGSINARQSESFHDMVDKGFGSVVSKIMKDWEKNDPEIQLKRKTRTKKANELDEKTASLDDFRRLAPDRLREDPELFDRLYEKEFGKGSDNY